MTLAITAICPTFKYPQGNRSSWQVPRMFRMPTRRKPGRQAEWNGSRAIVSLGLVRTNNNGSYINNQPTLTSSVAPCSPSNWDAHSAMAMGIEKLKARAQRHDEAAAICVDKQRKVLSVSLDRVRFGRLDVCSNFSSAPPSLSLLLTSNRAAEPDYH